MTASVDVLRGQSNLKTQKFLQKWSEIARSNFCMNVFKKQSMVAIEFHTDFAFWGCFVVHKGQHGIGILGECHSTSVLHGSTYILHDPRRLDFINRVSHGRRSGICSICAYWGCLDLRGHHGMVRRMHVSYSGPREDVSLKALGGYAPSALQTDILPRSRVGDIYTLNFC